MERNPQCRRLHRTPWIGSAALLVALLASCKDSTAPHAAAAVVAVGKSTFADTVSSKVTVAVQVIDGAGNRVRDASVSFVVRSGNGSVNPGTTSTDESGTATATWTLGTTAGTGSDALVAASGTLPSVLFAATTAAAAPAAVKILAGDNQAGVLGLPVPFRPTATVTDRFGNPSPVSGIGITFSVATGSGSFSGSNSAPGTLVASSLAGTVFAASDDWILGGTSPTQTLTASSQGLAPATITATAIAPPGPTNADWVQLAGQFAEIAADAFARATAPASATAIRGVAGGAASLSRQQARPQLNVAPTFTASYMCCSLFAASSNAFAHSAKAVTVTGQTSTTLDAGGSGSIAVSGTITESATPPSGACFANCDLPFTSTQALVLPSPGLTVSAVLSVVSGVVGAVQQVHLTGSLAYYSGSGGSPHSASADVTFGFDNYLQPPVVATGVVGVSLNGATLPDAPMPNRADLPAYPTLVSASAIGVQGQADYFGPPGTTSTTPTGLFWTWLECPVQVTATGGDLSNVLIAVNVAWPTVSADYMSVPSVYGISRSLTLAVGQSIGLTGGNPLPDSYWGMLGPSTSGTRTPWNALYLVSYTVKSTGQNATYTLAYSCQ